MDKPKSISRRAWLKRTVQTAAAVVVYSSVSESVVAATETAKKATKATKATKASVHYQGYPSDGRACGSCKYFIPPNGKAGGGMMGGTMGLGMMRDGTCQLVQGWISPMGYCVLYSAA